MVHYFVPSPSPFLFLDSLLTRWTTERYRGNGYGKTKFLIPRVISPPPYTRYILIIYYAYTAASYYTKWICFTCIII